MSNQQCPCIEHCDRSNVEQKKEAILSFETNLSYLEMFRPLPYTQARIHSLLSQLAVRHDTFTLDLCKLKLV